MKRFQFIDFLYNCIFVIPLWLGAFLLMLPYSDEWIGRFLSAGGILPEASEYALYRGIVFATGSLLLLILSFFCAKWMLLHLVSRAISIVLLGTVLGVLAKNWQDGSNRHGGELLIWLLLVLIVDFLRRLRLRKQEVLLTPEKHMLFTAAFLALILPVLYFAPVSEQPMDWSGVVNFCDNLAKRSIAMWHELPWGGAVNYEQAQVGFSERAGIFGKIQHKKQNVMNIWSDALKDGPLYLCGKKFDTFDGKNWTRENAVKSTSGFAFASMDGRGISGTYEDRMDLLETQACVEENYYERLEDMYRLENATIEILDLRTNLLFAASKAIPKDVQSEDGVWKYGDVYDFSFFRMNGNGEKLAQSHVDFSDRTWREVCRKRNVESVPGFQLTDLAIYQQQVWDTYQQEMHNSAWVDGKLAEITKGATTEYEIVKSIEKWLQQKEYATTSNLDLQAIDSPEAFLEAFLQEDANGFCTHYATAFILMAWSEGIPARFAQGFRLPRMAGGGLVVTSSMAHAWPEVYFPGVGWVSFEPTPGYLEPVVWEEKHPEPILRPAEDVQTIPVVESTPKGPKDRLPEEEWQALEDARLEQLAQAQQLAEEEDAREKEHRRALILGMSYMLGVICLLLLVLACVRIWMQKRKVRQMTNQEKTMLYCCEAATALSYCRLPRQADETLEEYGKRLEEILIHEAEGDGEKPIENEVTEIREMLAFIPVCESLLYGEADRDDAAFLAALQDSQKSFLQCQVYLRKKAFLRYCQLKLVCVLGLEQSISQI